MRRVSLWRCAQVRVLNKEPKGRDVDAEDSFSFNKGFSEKLFRIKINSIQMKETEEENKKTNEQVRLAPRQARHRCCCAPFVPTWAHTIRPPP